MLEAAGLASAADFLTQPGVVVSGHVGRNVSRVEIGGRTAYLKCEHRVRWRDRFRAWRDGFGWVSMSAREAAVLKHLDQHGLPGPRWLANGEAGGAGFLLVDDAGPAVPIAVAGPVSATLAEKIGHVVAELHAAGIEQPDLFAKHFLVDPGTDELTILDWQRAVIRPRVGWRQRVRGLAALLATAPPGVFDLASWDRLLTAYLAAGCHGGPVPRAADLRARVLATAERLGRRPGIRKQTAAAAAGAQELVRIGGETVCAVPAAAPWLDNPTVISALHDPANDGRPVTFGPGAAGTLAVRRYRNPLGRWWAASRGRHWRSAELRLARLLFHLERHGIPAPRLAAYGQTSPRLRPATAFVLYRARPVRLPERADRPAVRDLLDRLHAAGVRLSGAGAPALPFGVDENGHVVITDPRPLCLAKRLARRQTARDLRRLDAYFRDLG